MTNVPTLLPSTSFSRRGLGSSRMKVCIVCATKPLSIQHSCTENMLALASSFLSKRQSLGHAGFVSFWVRSPSHQWCPSGGAGRTKVKRVMPLHPWVSGQTPEYQSNNFSLQSAYHQSFSIMGDGDTTVIKAPNGYGHWSPSESSSAGLSNASRGTFCILTRLRPWTSNRSFRLVLNILLHRHLSSHNHHPLVLVLVPDRLAQHLRPSPRG